MHVFPLMESHPESQVVVVEAPFGVPVSITVVPLAKKAPHVVEQEMPGGLLITIPVPPAKTTVSVGPVPPVPVKQTTVTVIYAVAMLLLLVVTVAETRPLPQSWPVAVRRPVEFTVAKPGVFEAHTTWFVRSFESGG